MVTNKPIEKALLIPFIIQSRKENTMHALTQRSSSTCFYREHKNYHE